MRRLPAAVTVPLLLCCACGDTRNAPDQRDHLERERRVYDMLPSLYVGGPDFERAQQVFDEVGWEGAARPLLHEWSRVLAAPGPVPLRGEQMRRIDRTLRRIAPAHLEVPPMRPPPLFLDNSARDEQAMLEEWKEVYDQSAPSD